MKIVIAYTASFHLCPVAECKHGSALQYNERLSEWIRNHRFKQLQFTCFKKGLEKNPKVKCVLKYFFLKKAKTIIFIIIKFYRCNFFTNEFSFVRWNRHHYTIAQKTSKWSGEMGTTRARAFQTQLYNTLFGNWSSHIQVPLLRRAWFQTCMTDSFNFCSSWPSLSSGSIVKRWKLQSKKMMGWDQNK